MKPLIFFEKVSALFRMSADSVASLQTALRKWSGTKADEIVAAPIFVREFADRHTLKKSKSFFVTLPRLRTWWKRGEYVFSKDLSVFKAREKERYP